MANGNGNGNGRLNVALVAGGFYEWDCPHCSQGLCDERYPGLERIETCDNGDCYAAYYQLPEIFSGILEWEAA